MSFILQFGLIGSLAVGFSGGALTLNNHPAVVEPAVVEVTVGVNLTEGNLINSPGSPEYLRKLIVVKAEEASLDSQLALAIAFCESSFRQFDREGGVLRGRRNPGDVGVFQINEDYHLAKSRELGFDIYATEGNIAYAIWLIKNEGARHWRWSRGCWAK